MASKNEPEGNQGRGIHGGKGGGASRAQLEAAQRIARETLEADHQALERDARLAFRGTGS